jgi:nickel/cobalt exporter
MLRRRHVLLLIALAVALGLAPHAPAPVGAHPLGNFSISQYAGLRIERDAVELRYVVDMAEIPTFQEMQETGLVPDPAHPTATPYLAGKARSLAEGLRLEVDGRAVPLEVASRQILFPPGAGDLPTLKMGIVYRAALAGRGGVSELRYRDLNFEGRAGWKEVIAVAGPGVALREASVPDRDRSRELADYPTDLLNSPPQVLEARVVFDRESSARPIAAAPPATPPPAGSTSPGALTDAASRETVPSPDGALSLRPNAQATPRSAFTDLVTTRQLGVGVVVTALLVAAALGALHALEPGHGKTVVAAYLVGSRGTAWHAFVLGLVVTASHTAGVYVLGAVTFMASRYVLPEQLYPWLGVASGLTIAGLGFVLFLRRYAAWGHGHDHAHGHDHGEMADHQHDHAHGGDGHSHTDGHHHHHPAPGDAVSLRALVALGVTGGIVPCPAALVVLLSALSLRRIGFGMLLIVAFSVGLAAVLIAIGVLMVYARRLMTRFREDSPLVTRWLPLASSAVITIVGAAIAVQALVTAGIVQLRLG